MANSAIDAKIYTVDVWDLHSRPDLVFDAARAWQSIAHTVRDAADGVNAPALALVHGVWRGPTAETFDAHRKALVADLDRLADQAKAVGDLHDKIATTVSAAQIRLTTEWGTVVEVQFEDAWPGALAFLPRTPEQETTVQESIEACHHIRTELDRQLGDDLAALRQARQVFDQLAAVWQSVAAGTTVPFTVPAGDAAGVIYLDDEIVVNTGPGNDDVSIGVDPATGLQLVTVNGEKHYFPPGINIVVRGGEGNDTITVAPGAKVHLTLLGSDGDDTIRGGDNGATILGLGGNDKLYGGAGDDRISAGAGRDDIEGGAGNDTLDGGSGDDTIYGLDGDDSINGGEGQDYLEGANGNDAINGGSGNDIISGGNGDDTMRGGSGDDVFYAGRGNDVSYGGQGDDKVFGESTDVSAGVEQNVTVQIKDLGQHISIQGSPEFQARVQADLDMLRSSPDGQEMLAALDKAHDATAGGFLWWHHDGDTLTIREYSNPLDPNNSTTSMNGNTVVIAYNPHLDILPMNGNALDTVESPPVTVLYHEMAHGYDFMNNTFAPGTYTGSDNLGMPDLEREAAGLPIDGDHNPATPPQLYDKHPFDLTENGLRGEMGAPNRPRY
jgi:hypothetical protein